MRKTILIEDRGWKGGRRYGIRRIFGIAKVGIAAGLLIEFVLNSNDLSC